MDQLVVVQWGGRGEGRGALPQQGCGEGGLHRPQRVVCLGGHLAPAAPSSLPGVTQRNPEWCLWPWPRPRPRTEQRRQAGRRTAPSLWPPIRPWVSAKQGNPWTKVKNTSQGEGSFLEWRWARALGSPAPALPPELPWLCTRELRLVGLVPTGTASSPASLAVFQRSGHTPARRPWPSRWSPTCGLRHCPVVLITPAVSPVGCEP